MKTSEIDTILQYCGSVTRADVVQDDKAGAKRFDVDGHALPIVRQRRTGGDVVRRRTPLRLESGSVKSHTAISLE